MNLINLHTSYNYRGSPSHPGMMAGPMPVRGPGGQGPRSTGTGMRGGPLARSDTYGGESSRHVSFFIYSKLHLLSLYRPLCIFICKFFSLVR